MSNDVPEPAPERPDYDDYTDDGPEYIYIPDTIQHGDHPQIDGFGVPPAWYEARRIVSKGILPFLDATEENPNGTVIPEEYPHGWEEYEPEEKRLPFLFHAVFSFSRISGEVTLHVGTLDTFVFGCYFKPVMWEPEPEWPPDHTEIYPWCCVVDEDTRYGTPDDRMEVAQGFRKWFLGAIKDRFDGEETTAEPAPPPWDEGPEEIFRYIVEHSEPPKHLIRDVQRVEGWPHVARKLRETEQDWDMKLTEGNLRAQYCEHKPDPESQNNTQGEIGPEGYEERRKRERKKKERELGINGNVNDR